MILHRLVVASSPPPPHSDLPGGGRSAFVTEDPTQVKSTVQRLGLLSFGQSWLLCRLQSFRERKIETRDRKNSELNALYWRPFHVAPTYAPGSRLLAACL